KSGARVTRAPRPRCPSCWPAGACARCCAKAAPAIAKNMKHVTVETISLGRGMHYPPEVGQYNNKEPRMAQMKPDYRRHRRHPRLWVSLYLEPSASATAAAFAFNCQRRDLIIPSPEVSFANQGQIRHVPINYEVFTAESNVAI